MGDGAVPVILEVRYLHLPLAGGKLFTPFLGVFARYSPPLTYAPRTPPPLTGGGWGEGDGVGLRFVGMYRAPDHPPHPSPPTRGGRGKAAPLPWRMRQVLPLLTAAPGTPPPLTGGGWGEGDGVGLHFVGVYRAPDHPPHPSPPGVSLRSLTSARGEGKSCSPSPLTYAPRTPPSLDGRGLGGG